MWSRKLKCANRSTKRCNVAGSTRSAPLMMPSTSPRSSPARSLSVVLRAAKSKAKLGAAENACGVAGQGSHPPGRPFQERNRTRQFGAIAAQDRCADSQHQTHVVVEGQPRHDRGIDRALTVGQSAKKPRISCSKFTWTLRCEIITPVGSRVEPELYCRYATFGKSAVRTLAPPSTSRFNESISTIFGAVSIRD